jgi:hypothetical protein
MTIPEQRLVSGIPASVNALLKSLWRRCVIAWHDAVIEKKIGNRLLNVNWASHWERASLKKPPTSLVERLEKIKRRRGDIIREVREEEDTRAALRYAELGSLNELRFVDGVLARAQGIHNSLRIRNRGPAATTPQPLLFSVLGRTRSTNSM